MWHSRHEMMSWVNGLLHSDIRFAADPSGSPAARLLMLGLKFSSCFGQCCNRYSRSVEEMGSGAAYCQLMDLLFPGATTHLLHPHDKHTFSIEYVL